MSQTPNLNRLGVEYDLGSAYVNAGAKCKIPANHKALHESVGGQAE